MLHLQSFSLFDLSHLGRGVHAHTGAKDLTKFQYGMLKTQRNNLDLVGIHVCVGEENLSILNALRLIQESVGPVIEHLNHTHLVDTNFLVKQEAFIKVRVKK